MMLVTRELTGATLLDMFAARCDVAVEFRTDEFCEIKEVAILPWSGYVKVTCFNKYTLSCKLEDTLNLRFED